MLKRFFVPKNICPTCKKTLSIKKSGFFSAHIIKQCPDGHYTKEYHPALETAVEIFKQ